MYLSTHSFAPSLHIRESAWLEHSPFVFWLIDILRPKKAVELGTHNGFSFLSQCQIAKSIGLDASIYAIDTWRGDEHAGFYSPEVYDNLEAEVRHQYPDLGRLIRSTFADARSEFENGSVDLLHIDGRHRYEDVKEDFETWKDVLSDKGVILFHDTCVRRDDFGVYKFWSEISYTYPSFEFFHGNGLGILLIGNSVPFDLKQLCSDSFEAKKFVREAYARLGFFNSMQFEKMHIASMRDNLQSIINTNCKQITEYRDKITFLNKEVDRLDTNIKNLNSILESTKDDRDEQITRIKLENHKLQKDLTSLKAVKDSILASTSWKITKPLRVLKSIFSR